MMRVPGLVGVVVLICGVFAGSQGLRAAQDTMSSFRHVQHEEVQCLACHRMETTHGASTIRTVEDCRSCHHTEQAVRECGACHVELVAQDQVFTLSRTFTLSVEAEATERELPFRHSPHESLTCMQCHDEGPTLAVPELDCQSCHEEHHSVSVTGCLSCHQEPPSEAHALVVHSTCSGSGCHEDVPVGSSPRNRVGCLWCHQEQTEHEPEAECVSCHLMPPPRPFE